MRGDENRLVGCNDRSETGDWIRYSDYFGRILATAMLEQLRESAATIAVKESCVEYYEICRPEVSGAYWFDTLLLLKCGFECTFSRSPIAIGLLMAL